MQRAHGRALGDPSLQPHGKRESRPGLARRPAQSRAGDRIAGSRARHARSVAPSRKWEFLPSLLDAASQESAFTLENGIWRASSRSSALAEPLHTPITRARTASRSVTATANSACRRPSRPCLGFVIEPTGTIANLPADSVTSLADPSGSSSASTLLEVATGVRNPFAITTGVDPEDPVVLRQLAPEAFQVETFRAVRDEDYREHAQKVEGVQRAGARARWTGSWSTEFVTVDPANAFSLSDELRTKVENALDRVRQVGREVYVNDPVYVNVDLVIRICIVQPTPPGVYVQEAPSGVLQTITGVSTSVAAFVGMVNRESARSTYAHPEFRGL